MANEQQKKKTGLSRPRNLATLLSILVPGLGQFYNRRFLKGALFLIVTISFLITTWNYIDIGIWGLYTLGTLFRSHHSIQLLIQGLISLIVLLFGIAIYIYNIRDARADAIARELGKKKETLLQGVKNFYDQGFPYFMVLPGLLMLIFVVVLPLLFMVSLAFTNYNQYNLSSRKFLDWVGFDNFAALFDLGFWID